MSLRPSTSVCSGVTAGAHTSFISSANLSCFGIPKPLTGPGEGG